jgi:hypothetical protein
MLAPPGGAIARRSLIDAKRRSRSPFPPPPPSDGDVAPSGSALPPGAEPTVDADPLRAPTPSAIGRQFEPPRMWMEPGRPAGPPVPPMFEPPPLPPSFSELDPPALEPVREPTDELVKPNAPLLQYVRHQESPGDGATPFLADRPFGDQTFFGNQMTPFFVNDSAPAADYDTDDTDGIPTGLPDLLNLAPLGTAPPPPAARAPAANDVWVPSTDVSALERDPDAMPPWADSAQPSPSVGPMWGGIGFMLGLVVASALWALLT